MKDYPSLLEQIALDSFCSSRKLQPGRAVELACTNLVVKDQISKITSDDISRIHLSSLALTLISAAQCSTAT